MRRLFLSICLLVIVGVLTACQKKEDGMTFESIYTDKEITKIVYGKNGNFKELTDFESINKWVNDVRNMKFIRYDNQEERQPLLLFDGGCLVKAYHKDEEIGDFKLRKLNGVYYKENTEFDKQVKSLCQ
ncbi:hypothetical protein [Gottfriedia acidiceleris]|uniref:hypothetical protein n=1 Tax=Gottfriedia acidiceleris TaxID=371036 RepID=UPI000B4532D2|nr:hypothetical protein [Gottfriedia acidiceleris]